MVFFSELGIPTIKARVDSGAKTLCTQYYSLHLKMISNWVK
jgi:hypothetical protein